MHITFGVHLDNHLGPSSIDTFHAAVVGRNGFLGLLETYLGLARPDVSSSKRITIYLRHLRQHEDQPRFYSQSLQADSVGTAAKLLAWRDEWRLAGWNGAFPVVAPKRLVEMSLVEQSAAGDVPPGEAERLAAVVVALQTQPCPVQSVLLVDPPETLPWAWRNVLHQLPNVSYWRCAPQGEGQLRQLQERALEALNTGMIQSSDDDIQDGSVVLIEASSRELAEHWLSAASRHTDVDRLLLCEAHGDSLDATLVATGFAASGFKRSSVLRPALQALGLAFEMCWSPVDVSRLIEFLTHPIGPFSRKARSMLARAVASKPGIGGDAWNAEKAHIQGFGDGKALLEDIAFWLESTRWNRLDGVPVDALLVRVDMLAATLRKRLSGTEQEHTEFAPAVAQCAAVREGIVEFKAQGLNRLLPRQIEQLIAHATAPGAPNPRVLAQVGCLRAETSPGACIEAAEEVIWWMPSYAELPPAHPWNQRELAVLSQCGLELRDPKQGLDALAMQWLMPLLAAKQHFVVMLPPAGAEEHPFLQLIKRLLPKLFSQRIRLDEHQGAPFARNLLQDLQRKPLPPTPRHIDPGRAFALPKKGQSYSSLSELFNDPALYALKRIADLQPTSVLSAGESNRLLGTLAHRVIELLFKQPDSLAWSADQAITWFRSSIDALLATEGAVLLMQGAGVTQQRFKSVCEGAIRSLSEHIQAAGVAKVHTEFKLEGMLGDVQLDGCADLILELQGGRFVVLDMKWSGDNSYKSILAKGEHLQLAVYASLFKQQTGSAPVALGYFVLQSGAIYLTAPDVMPLAQVLSPPTGSSATLLDQAKASWQWRAQQWADGVVEVVPVQAGDEYQGAGGTLPVKGPRDWDKDHLVLLGGWE